MLVHKLYKSYWKEWKEQITIHLLFNHRPYLDKENFETYGVFNETTIMSYNQTFGFMARGSTSHEVCFSKLNKPGKCFVVVYEK